MSLVERVRASRRNAAKKTVVRHPVNVPPAESWVGTDDDPVWRVLRDRVESLSPMKDLQRTMSACEGSVANLVAFAGEPGHIGAVGRRALHSLAMDIHIECRNAVAMEDRRNAASHDDTTLRRLIAWLRSPVGSGEPHGADPGRLQAVYAATALVRLAGAFSAALLLTLGITSWPVVALLSTATFSGIMRFRTNAESAGTFRAKYLSCTLGHLGDAMVLGACTVHLITDHSTRWIAVPTLGTVLTMFFGTLMRVGALQVGVHVARLRLERVFRTGGLTAGLAGVAIGHPGAILITFVLIAGYSGVEIIRCALAVWSNDATEFAWTVRTGDQFVTEVLTAPAPMRSEEEQLERAAPRARA
jgi:hypothetical protein